MRYSHKCLVVAANLLNVDIVLAVDIGFGGGVAVSHCNHTGDILEVIMVVDLYL